MIKERDIYENLQKQVTKKEYSIIIGARQVGKTTLIQKLYSELIKNEKNVFFVTFEDHNILKHVNSDPENIFKYAKKPDNPLLTKSKKKKTILFIDEIQYAEDPSHLLKYLYDTYQENLKIIATGSSAFYIDKKFKDSLAGRKRIFQLKPLNFNEFLQFKDANELSAELIHIRENDIYISRFYKDILQYFDEYLIFGGYPAVVLENEISEKKLYLEELITSFLKKDIYESKIEQESKFYNLCSVLASQIGGLINKNELANTLNLNQRTIEKYLYILQKCFYIDLLPPFFQNIRKEISKMPKVYFFDFGIRNKFLDRFFDFDQREDKGQLLENYVYIRLNEIFSKDQINFWRTADRNEVDFIVSETYGRGTAYEVKFSDINYREKKYSKFCKTYPQFPLKCISYQSEKNSIPVLKI